jgi:hypothetical protein
MEMKQTKYDTKKKQLSNLYGSLLNSPMLRDSNIKTRDEFFKAIDYEIKKISDLDLSIEENVQQASQMFGSLYDDKNIVKDMMWTENYYDQKKRGDSFRNCFDPEKCGGEFWETGLMALDYRAEEFRNASDEEAMSMGNVRYTPYVNIMKEAGKLLKDLNWQPISIDDVTGDGYITTTTNGPVAQGPLLQIFSQAFQQDPRLQEMYRTQAYVERKQWVKGNAAQYGSEEAAEQVWLQDKQNAIDTMFASLDDDLDFNGDVEKQKKAELEERIKKEGTTGDDALAAAYLESLKNESKINDTKKLTDNVLTVSSNARNAQTINRAAEALDGAYAAILFNNDLQNTAISIAEIGKKFEIKGDPTYAARLNAAAKKAEEEQATNGFFDLGFTVLGPSDGSVDPKVDEDGNVIPDAESQMLQAEVEGSDDRLANAQINNQILNTVRTDALNGRGGQSAEDLLNMTSQLITTYDQWARRVGSAGDKKDALKKLKSWKKKTKKEKLAWAKTNGFDYISKKLDGKAQQDLFDNGTAHLVNKVEQQDPNSLYLSNNVSQLKNQIRYVQRNDANQNSWAKIYTSYHSKAADKMALEHKDSPLGAVFQYVVGNNGMRGANQTAVAYANDRSVGSEWGSVVPYKEGEKEEMMSRFLPQVPDFMNPGAQMVVGRDGKEVRRDQLEGTPEHTMRNAREAMLFATGDAMAEKTPSVTIPSTDGKSKRKVSVGDFFDDEGFIDTQFATYADSFEWADDDASVDYAKNFAYAKYAWEFGDKKDAWTIEDGKWVPNPYKERTTMVGRWGRNIVSALTYGKPGMHKMAGDVYGLDSTIEYFKKYTDWDYMKDDKSQMQEEIEGAVSDVSTPEGRAFGDVTDLGGSFASKGLRSTFAPWEGGVNKYNMGFLDYYKASTSQGIGTDAGNSWVEFGGNKADAKRSNHNSVAFDTFTQMVQLANSKQAKGKSIFQLEYDYYSTGAGDTTMQAMTVRPVFDAEGEKLMNKLIFSIAKTTKKDSDAYQEAYDLVNSGITLYQPDNVAVQNGGHYFYNTTKVNNLEKIMSATSEIQVPGYDDISTLKIVKKGGQYVIQGDVQKGWDYDNNKPHMAYQEQTWPLETPISDILYNQPFYVDGGTRQVNGLDGYLKYVKQSLKDAGEYKAGDRIYDPSFVSDEWYDYMTQKSEISGTPRPIQKDGIIEKAAELHAGQGIDYRNIELKGNTAGEKLKNFFKSIPF